MLHLLPVGSKEARVVQQKRGEVSQDGVSTKFFCCKNREMQVSLNALKFFIFSSCTDLWSICLQSYHAYTEKLASDNLRYPERTESYPIPEPVHYLQSLGLFWDAVAPIAPDNIETEKHLWTTTISQLLKLPMIRSHLLYQIVAYLRYVRRDTQVVLVEA